MFTPSIILQIVLVFFVLVTIHEWGHFYFAKRAGILVREFAIGFGPKLFSFRRNETQYTLRLLPIGGFVRMAGEDPEIVDIRPGQTVGILLEDHKVKRIVLDKLDERAYSVRGTVKDLDLERELVIRLEADGKETAYPVHPQAMIVVRDGEMQIAPWDRQFGGKTVPQRAMTIFAGPLMNFVLAFILFFAYVFLSGIPVENPTHVLVGRVSDNSPAEKAGLKSGDVIEKVNGVAIGANRQKLIEYISASANQKMEWIIVRDGQRMSIEIVPQPQDGIGRVGVSLQLPTRPATVGEAFTGAAAAMQNATVQILQGLRMLVTLQFDWDDLGGPVQIAKVTGEAASHGIATLTFWTALFSLYLGIFNLLPFPALDGSRLMFLAIEALRGKPVDPKRESMVHFIGFAMLMLLMLAVTYNDIMRLFRS